MTMLHELIGKLNVAVLKELLNYLPGALTVGRIALGVAPATRRRCVPPFKLSENGSWHANKH